MFAETYFLSHSILRLFSALFIAQTRDFCIKIFFLPKSQLKLKQTKSMADDFSVKLPGRGLSHMTSSLRHNSQCSCEATSAEAILGGPLCVDISHSPLGCPCQSQDMWLQESPPALSLTPPIDFPSRRSVSLNRFNQGDPPSLHTQRRDRLICASLAGLTAAMTFIHLYILPARVTPSTGTVLTLKKRNSVWIIFSSDLRTMDVNMWPNIMVERCYLCHIIISNSLRMRSTQQTWPKYIFRFICLQLSNKTYSLHFHLWASVPVGVAGWEMLCFQASGNSDVSNVQGRRGGGEEKKKSGTLPKCCTIKREEVGFHVPKASKGLSSAVECGCNHHAYLRRDYSRLWSTHSISFVSFSFYFPVCTIVLLPLQVCPSRLTQTSRLTSSLSVMGEEAFLKYPNEPRLCHSYCWK